MTTGRDRWRLGPGARWLDGTTLAGGTPYRVITLTPRGAGVVRGVVAGAPPPADQPAVDRLMHRLRAAGLLLAPSPAAADHDGVTVVIPARSATAPVRELVAALPADVPIVLVDDGPANRCDYRYVGRAGGKPSREGVELGVELTPDGVVLRLEIPEERTPADSGGGCDLVDRRFVEAPLGEDRQADLLQLAPAGRGRPPG